MKANTPLPYTFVQDHRIAVHSNEEVGCLGYYEQPTTPQRLCELMAHIPNDAPIKGLSPKDFENKVTEIYKQGAGAAQQALDGINANMDLSALMQAIPTSEDLLAQQDDAPVIALINALLSQAIARKASDVHFEVYEKHVAVRLRADGILHEVLRPERALAALLVSRLKVMAHLDIAEKRLPQDGRIALTVAGHPIDVRTSTLPTHYGERVVLRILDKKSVPLDLNHLGISAQHLKPLKKLIRKPHGIILVTGPTGSGKTTTLYAALSELNESQRNIMTVEDPVEYDLEGISQTQVNRKIDMDFARGLRAILRQDPDVVMVGEIRDKETVEMAMQASLTGHLVFSTLHTNTALGAIARLRDMGAAPFLLASTLLAVVAQRLVRKLCPHCKEAYEASDFERQQLQAGEAKCILFKPQGCAHCHESGFSGRMAVYELVEITDSLKQSIHEKASEHSMRATLQKAYKPLQEDAMRLVCEGETSLDEALILLGASDGGI